MSAKFQLLIIIGLISIGAMAQNGENPSLKLGDPAPPLRVRAWIKGEPIQNFKKGKVYVLEFWATWCGPCIAAMPHLSALADKYRDRVDIIGVNAFERKSSSIKKLKAFVDSLGQRMNYHVSIDDSNFMGTEWMAASAQRGIPASFVVDGDGKLAWIGQPFELDQILSKVLDSSWDIKAALAKRNFDKYLQKLDSEMNDTLNTFVGDDFKKDYVGKPEAALALINEIVKKEPALKYAPFVSSHTFAALLKTNPHKAYEFGKIAIQTATYEDPNYHLIIENIRWYSDKIYLPPEIYMLGAETHGVKLKYIPYTDQFNMVKLYKTMADWYCRGGDPLKAVNAQKKAIEALNNKKDFSALEMATLKSQLEKYEKSRRN